MWLEYGLSRIVWARAAAAKAVGGYIFIYRRRRKAWSRIYGLAGRSKLYGYIWLMAGKIGIWAGLFIYGLGAREKEKDLGVG